MSECVCGAQRNVASVITQKEKEKSHPSNCSASSSPPSPREAQTAPASGLDFNTHDPQPSVAYPLIKVGGKKKN